MKNLAVCKLLIATSDVAKARAALAAPNCLFKRAALGVGIASSAWMTPALAQDAVAASESDQGFGEILVTANKKSESLQDVPTAVAVISAEDLKGQGVTGYQDFMTLVPGLATNSQGGPGFGAVILRGLNTGYAQTSNAVGNYVDETPYNMNSPLALAALITADADLTDVDRLEVLKGPQSTLYGASTLGGLVKISLRKPDLNDFEGEVQLEGSAVDGGGNGYNVAGIVNAPLVEDQLAIRVNAYARRTPGYMTNAASGEDDLGYADRHGGRVALRWAPSDGMDIQLSAQLQDQKTRGWNFEFIDPVTQQPLFGRYAYNTALENTFDSNVKIFSGVVNYEVGDVGTLTSATSYNLYKGEFHQDWTPSYGSFSFLAPDVVPTDVALDNNVSFNYKKFAQEVRFTTKRLGNFEGTLGGYYTHEKVQTRQFVTNVAQATPIPATSILVQDVIAPATYKEFAFFANATYHVGDVLDLTAGGRYSKNTQDIETCQTGYGVPGGFVGCFANSSSDDNFTYLLSAVAHLSPDTNVYGRVATSYRPGGPQQYSAPGFPSTFGADTLINYEIGLKGSWLDNRLRANVAAFQMDWKDVQLTVLDPNTFFTFVFNAGKARVRGAELELAARPATGLTFTANAAYLDAKLTAVSPDATATSGATAGDQLPYTPKWSASGTADYEHNLSDTAVLKLGATLRFQGRKISGYPADALNTGVQISSYATLDLRAGVNFGNFEVMARATNVTNTHGVNSIVNWRFAPFDNSVPSWASVIAPRTYSLGVTAKF